MADQTTATPAEAPTKAQAAPAAAPEATPTSPTLDTINAAMQALQAEREALLAAQAQTKVVKMGGNAIVGQPQKRAPKTETLPNGTVLTRY